jgi:hypothetical protein
MYLLVCSITSIESLAGFRVLFDYVGARGVFSSINETFSHRPQNTSPVWASDIRRTNSLSHWSGQVTVPHDCQIATSLGRPGNHALQASGMAAAFCSATAKLVSGLNSAAGQDLADPDTWTRSALRTLKQFYSLSPSYPTCSPGTADTLGRQLESPTQFRVHRRRQIQTAKVVTVVEGHENRRSLSMGG